MRARAEARADPDKTSSVSTEHATGERRDAGYGIVIAVIAAAFFWPIVVGLYLYLSR